MTDIDLIPADYRNRLWLRGKAGALGGGVGVLVLLMVLLVIAMHFLSRSATERITELQARQAISAQQRDELAKLDSERVALEGRLQLLNGLRGGAAAAEMFAAIDHSMVAGDVWFEGWEFNRAGSVVDRKKEAVTNGYFIVIPAEQGSESSEAWKIETHMKIRGQAKDHSALSGFVRRLYQQPEIQEVRILNTSVASGSRFVDFNLAITVNSNGEKG